MAKVFISYRRTDSSQIVGRIDDRLEATLGRKNVFRDLDSIHGGANFVGKINEAINQTDVALIVIGPHWIDATNDKGNRRLDNPRDFVRLEVEAALNRDSCRTIPILVNGAHMPNDTVLPDSLKPLALRNAMSVRDDPDFRRDMERVIGEIKTPSVLSLQPITARVGSLLNSPLMIALIGGLFVLGAAFLASWLPPYLQAQQQNGTTTAQALVAPGSTTPIGTSVALITNPTVSATPSTTLSFTSVPASATPHLTDTPKPTLTLRSASATSRPMPVILVTATAPDTPVSVEDSASTLDAQYAQTAVAAQTLTATFFTHTPTATPTPTIDTSSTVNAIRTQRVIGTHAAQQTLTATHWTRTPTPSFTPTYTATPTITPTPTLTPIPPTATSVPPTATPTPTFTPIPSTATNVPPTPTFTPIPPTATNVPPTPIFLTPTNTATATFTAPKTYTPTFTFTPSDTPTSTATSTSTSTATPSSSPNTTPTPVPINLTFTTCLDYVLYTSGQAGNTDVLRLNLSAPKTPTRLTDNNAANSAPSRSPDSKWVTFQSNRSGHYEIYAIGADGKTLQQLTQSATGDNMYPAWGALNLIAYEHHEGNSSQISIVDPNTRTVIAVSSPQEVAVHAVWSPDGKTLAYESQTNGHWDIMLYKVGAGLPTPLTQTAGDNQGIAWSPNGNQIAFRSTRNGQPDLYVTSRDGKRTVRLTNTPATKRDIAWAADGVRIAYDADDASGQSQIYVLSVVEPLKSAQITKTQYPSHAPTWRCDNSQIVYSAQESGVNTPSHLYRVASTGGTPTVLTIGASSDEAPAIGASGGNANRSDGAR